MIDSEKENREIENKFIYTILIPKQIGQLNSNIVFNLGKIYSEKPLLWTIKKSQLVTEKEKKLILQEMLKDKAYKEHRKNY